MSDENKNSLEEQKGVAYYSALVNAWITTRMEKDKQLLTLSAAGIGLIIIFAAFLIITFVVKAIDLQTVDDFKTLGPF